MEKKEKQNVIVFTEKDLMKKIGSKVPNGDYDEKALYEALEAVFPKKRYNFGIVDYPKDKLFRNIDDMWMQVRTPILIGFGKGANYIEPIKNYKRKYIISPYIFKNGYNAPESYDKDSYDAENTVCFFGGDEKSRKDAETYSKYYPHTFSEICDGRLELVEAIGYVGIYDLLMFKSKQQF